MYANNHHLKNYMLILLFSVLVIGVGACGRKTTQVEGSVNDAPVSTSADRAATTDDTFGQEQRAATDDDHPATTGDDALPSDSDNEDDSRGPMMSASDEANHGIMGGSEGMGHEDEAMPHDEGAAADEDMAAAHGVPEEYANMENPIESTDSSITRGAELFQANCAVCHGSTGKGDGVAAAGLDPKPANLSEDHVQDNPDGALFYTISKGVPGTAMVAWESQISEEDRWNLVNFIRTIKP